MNEFLLLWLSLSLSGSLIAVILVVVKPLLRKFSKTWQYYIWLLVVLRMLIPFSPDVSIIGGLFQQAQTHFTAEYTPSDESQQNSDEFLPENKTNLKNENIGTSNSLKPAVSLSFWKYHVWGALWLTAVMTLLFRKIYGYSQLVITVKKESKTVSDVEILSAFERVRKDMGITKRIPLFTNSLVQAPMLIGVFKPSVILPAKKIPHSELVYIFRHELTHYYRRDFLYKWLAEIMVCVHWFNPLAYWVRKQINRECEFSCDESVVVSLGNTERYTYGDTLLNSIQVNQRGSKNVVSLSLNEDAHLIKERLCAIMQYKRKSKFIVFIAVLLTSFLFCGAVFAGAYTSTAVGQAITSPITSPIRVNNQEISSNGKISLGSKQFAAGTECRVLFTWKGNGALTILCNGANGTEKIYTIENGKAAKFRIDTSGEYTISVKNNHAYGITDVNGSIAFDRTSGNQILKNSAVSSNTASGQSVVYENVEMLKYDGYPEINVEGYPYAHHVRTNNTDKKISQSERGMLAFDENGDPLKIMWYGLDSNDKPAYFFLFDRSNEEISPHQTDDTFGGWTLNETGTDKNVAKIKYVLYCDKKITFEDGTVWENPDFETWRTTYEGKKTDVSILDNYYPYEQKINDR